MSGISSGHEAGASLEQRLEWQTTNYLRAGYHRQLDSTPREFVDQFDALMEAVSGLEVVTADLPIMAVIPDTMLSLEDQLALSGNRAFLKSEDMQTVSTWDTEPNQPYALLGVSLGEEVKDLSADDARESFKAVGRTGLRLIELVNLGVHVPESFTVQDIRGRYAVETRHVLDGNTTVVDLYRYGDSLKVKRDPGSLNDPQWTTPSYHSRTIVG